MKRIRSSNRLQSGLSLIFVFFGLLYAVLEARLLWNHFLKAVRGLKGRRF